jgi:hypothetical protein
MYELIMVSFDSNSFNKVRYYYNPLKPSGNYMSHLSLQFVTLCFLFVGFGRFSLQTTIFSLNSINQFILVMVNCGVLFQVRLNS